MFSRALALTVFAVAAAAQTFPVMLQGTHSGV